MDYDFIPTNSMASASFDILKMDGIEEPSIDINKLATLDIEESYFIESIDFLNETNNELYKYKKELYVSLSEADNEYVILESFSDFFTKVKDVIEKFLKFIKTIFDKFIVYINAAIANDKFISQNKKELKKFTDADNFTFDGYDFTFMPNIPLPDAALKFNEDLFCDIYSKIGYNLSADGMKTVISNISSDLDNKYDEFRATVIGKPGVIYESEYDNELFKIYRCDRTDSTEIFVDKTYVNNCVKSYEQYAKLKSQLNNELSALKKSYKQIKDQVSNITKNNGSLSALDLTNKLPEESREKVLKNISTDNNGFVTGDLMCQLDLYVKAKTDEIIKYTNIHTMAYSAKLDALKASYIQDKLVLYKSISEIKNREMVKEED